MLIEIEKQTFEAANLRETSVLETSVLEHTGVLFNQTQMEELFRMDDSPPPPLITRSFALQSPEMHSALKYAEDLRKGDDQKEDIDMEN